MWWTKKEAKSSGRKQRSMSWSTYNGSSSLASGSLDTSKHRCSSIQSLLSLEQSLVTCDDESNIRLVPLACQPSNTGIPTEVEVEEEEAVEAEPTVNENEIVGLDLSTKSLPLSLPIALIDDAFSPLKRPEETNEKNIAFHIENTKAAMNISDCSPALTNTKGIKHTKENTQRAVRFGTVEVHHHKQEIGSTVPLRGPPVGLSWVRLSHETFHSVDNHLWETHPAGEPRPYKMLKLPMKQRADRLHYLGHTNREIRGATRDAGIVRTRRLQSARYSSRNHNWLQLLRKAKKSDSPTIVQQTPIHA